MKRLITLVFGTLLGVLAMPAQPFFSINAGNENFNFSFSNAPVFAPVLTPVIVAPPPPPPVPVCLPLRAGYDFYEYDVPRRIKKAAKRYRKAMRRNADAVGFFLNAGLVVGEHPGYYYDDDYYDNYRGRRHYRYYDDDDDDDDDDYEEWLEDRHEHHKKMYKRYKKAHKRYKKHLRRHHRYYYDD